MRAIYMGTPEIAAIVLERILKEKIEVIAVFTQPDKPKGRKKEVSAPPVKEAALAHNIPVYQPLKIKEESVIETIRELNPDIILVTAYGKILPPVLLNLPKYGCVNVHASLLPKYRGAAPIQQAIIDGETVTGITIIYMEEGIDTGDMILKKEVAISPKETGGSLHDKLAAAGGEALAEAIHLIEEGKVVRIPQNHSNSSYVGMLTKESGLLDFSKTAKELECLIRGLNPWPSAYTYLEEKTLKIWDADVCRISDFLQYLEKHETEINTLESKIKQTLDKPDSIIEKSNWIMNQISKAKEGCIVAADKKNIYIKCGDELLKVNELQLEGKRKMNTEEFLNGYLLKVGTLLKAAKNE